LYPESLHFAQPFPIRTLALEDCSGVNPNSSKTLGVTSVSGSLHSVQVFLADLWARVTCTECRVPDPDITPKALADFGFTVEQASRAKVQKGEGCPKCKDSGYKGRMGIYEILSVSKPIKEAILRKATTPYLA
jgi:type II secretory ATPase GspE/PulE/Tfp pilus assembly ATPase PilB-like protein